MANTFELIASSTVGSGGASSIDFTSIPSTYTDLCLVVSARGTAGLTRDDLRIKFNSSSSGYSGREVRGYDSGSVGSTTSSATYFDCARIPSASATASTFGNTSVYIPNYAGSANKSFSVDDTSENNSSAAYYLSLSAGLWSNTAAITSINLTTSINFDQYSTAYL